MINKDNLNRLDLEILSDVLFLALHAEKYKNVNISELYDKFIEMIKVGDFKVIREEETGLALAFTCWTFVSDEVLDDVLKSDRDVRHEEMNSGDNLLFIELFSTNNDYWKFFDYLTDYFLNNNEYEGKYPVDKNKIYSCCGFKMEFGDNGIRIDNTGTRVIN